MYYEDQSQVSKYASLEKQNRSLKELAAEQTLTINKLVQEKGEAENRVYDHQHRVPQYQKQIEELKRENERLKGIHSNGDTRAEVYELTTQASTLTSQVSRLQNDAGLLHSYIETLQQQISELKVVKERSDREAAQLRVEKEALEKEVREVRQGQLVQSSDGTSAKHVIEEQQRQNVELQRHILELKEEKQDLQGQVNETLYKLKQAQSKEASNAQLYGSQDLQRQKAELETRMRALTEQNSQMRGEIEYVTKMLNSHRHNTNSSFMDTIINSFQSLQLPPPSPLSSPPSNPQVPQQTTPLSYSGGHSAAASIYAAGNNFTSGINPPYYPNTPAPYTSSSYQYNTYPAYQPPNGGGTGYPYQGGSAGGSGGGVGGTGVGLGGTGVGLGGSGGVGAGVGASMRLSGGQIKPIPSFAIPAFCARNSSDLPDIIDVLNVEGKNIKPILKFKLEEYPQTNQ